jgi:hypothetical protein
LVVDGDLRGTWVGCPGSQFRFPPP